MEIRLIESEFYSNCYLLVNNYNVYIIDPSVDPLLIKQNLKEKERILGILLTHSHIDHVYYLEENINFFDCPVYMHNNALEILSDSYKNCSKMFGFDKIFNIKDNKIVFVRDSYYIDNLIKVIYTPGHSFDSLCFVFGDNIFTGDTLFKNSIGRTDLFSGNQHEIYKSIIKIYDSSNDYNIYPGHSLSSNLSLERINNFYVIEAFKNIAL